MTKDKVFLSTNTIVINAHHVIIDIVCKVKNASLLINLLEEVRIFRNKSQPNNINYISLVTEYFTLQYFQHKLNDIENYTQLP